MREYRFDPEGELPVVHAIIKGPQGRVGVTLVFDSGCALTQIHHQILKGIGLGENEDSQKITIGGVTGEGDPGNITPLTELRVFGTRFEGRESAGVDCSRWARSGIEGLLGWDVIRGFHF